MCFCRAKLVLLGCIPDTLASLSTCKDITRSLPSCSSLFHYTLHSHHLTTEPAVGPDRRLPHRAAQRAQPHTHDPGGQGRPNRCLFVATFWEGGTEGILGCYCYIIIVRFSSGFLHVFLSVLLPTPMLGYVGALFVFAQQAVGGALRTRGRTPRRPRMRRYHHRASSRSRMAQSQVGCWASWVASDRVYMGNFVAVQAGMRRVATSCTELHCQHTTSHVCAIIMSTPTCHMHACVHTAHRHRR